MAKTGVIHGINGPVVSLLGDPGFQMNEMVYVGAENLVGEVIGLTSGKTTVQVYEETSGIRPGETVTGTVRARPCPLPWPRESSATYLTELSVP